jgi:uncharacterized membrane protein
MKWNFRRDIFVLSLLVLFIIISLCFYIVLPQTVPCHFGSGGIADNYSSKESLIFISISVAISLYILFTFVPMIDPLKITIESKYGSILLFRDITMAFILIMLVLVYMSAKVGSLRTDVLGIAFGLMFIVLGNYLPRLPRNFFIGIRSPWTIASETVWVRTHRISGIWFVVAGVLLIVLNLLKVKLHISLIFVLTPLFLYTAIIYPYFLYKKLEKEGTLDKNI